MASNEELRFEHIIIGGSIAGVTCAETLSHLEPDQSVLLLTASPLIKAITNFRKVTRTLEEFDVEEQPMFDFKARCPSIHVVHKAVSSLDSTNKKVITTDGVHYTYETLCICTGGIPKLIAKDNPYVIGIRDTETVKVFQKKLGDARRVIVIGNGGIATELVYEVEGCEVLWAIKHNSITQSFIDEGAAQFFLPEISKVKTKTDAAIKRTKYRVEDDVGSSKTCIATDTCKVPSTHGCALGPDWSEGLAMTGTQGQDWKRVHVEYEVEVKQILSPEDLSLKLLQPDSLTNSKYADTSIDFWPVYVELTNGKIFGSDFIVSATGVFPNTGIFTHNNDFQTSEDGALLVDEHMLTTAPHVFAAGDVCHANWKHSQHWLQMRLWSQARQMGAYAARCMAADIENNLQTVTLDFCFEMFAHVTNFFNYKVVLLGKFNAQGLGNDHELLLRITKGKEYVKVVMKDGQMHGALLIGDTDLEETFENLILNQMDLTPFKDHLLDSNIDIEDFFD